MAPKIVDKEERRSVIIQAAAKIFAQKGYQVTTVNDIAEAAHMGKGTVYLYYKSKKDIFMAVSDYYMDSVSDQMETVVEKSSGTPTQNLIAISNMTIESLQNDSEIYGLIIEFWAATSRKEVDDLFMTKFKHFYAHWRAGLTRIIDRGIAMGEFRPDVDSQAVACMYTGALDSMGLQLWFDDEIDAKSVITNFTTILLRGLGVEKGA